MSAAAEMQQNQSRTGIAFIVFAVACMSVNDMIIKSLSGDYPLHQMVFIRSCAGLAFCLAMVRFEGGLGILRTDRPGLHLVRCLLIVAANMMFFAALAVLPLATTTSLFFVSPLLITVFSVIFLGEKVGPRRWGAVCVGFLGVLVMLRPGGGAETAAPLAIYLLPIAAAACYAGMNILTRRLGETSQASAMSSYIQATFIVVSLMFWMVAGDGRYADGETNASLQFLFRAWLWPAPADWPFFLFLGLVSAGIGYSVSQAYRLADAATVAPFEYVMLPFSIFWGWLVFGHLPDARASFGILLIVGSGVYVFLRERRRAEPPSP